MTSLKTWGRMAGVLAMALCGSAVAADPPATGATSLAAAYATLASKKFVDLTHAFGPATPNWKGSATNEIRESLDPEERAASAGNEARAAP